MSRSPEWSSHPALTIVAGKQRAKISARLDAGALEAGPTAGLGAVELPELNPHLGILQRDGRAIDHGGVPDLQAMLPPDQEAWQHTGRDHDIGAVLDQRTCAGDKILDHAGLRGMVSRERIGEILWLAAKTGHVDHAAAQAVTLGLLVVPDLEHRIERHKAKSPTEL